MADRSDIYGFVTIGNIARFFNKKHHVDYSVTSKNCHTFCSAIWMGLFGSSGIDLLEPKVIGLDSIFGGMNVPGPYSFELAKRHHGVNNYSLLFLW